MEETKTLYMPHSGSLPYGEDGGVLTILDGDCGPRSLDLKNFYNRRVYFGRGPDNEIVLQSGLVSKHHGYFEWKQGTLLVTDNPESANGILWNGQMVKRCELKYGDILRIDSRKERMKESVLFFLDKNSGGVLWKRYEITGASDICIGRAEDCEICLEHISVSLHHARICREAGEFYLYDTDSTNGTYVNGEKIEEKRKLQEKDVIAVTNSRLIFTSRKIFFCSFVQGLQIEARNIVRKVGKGKKQKVICNDVSLSINPCELVAIIGGSGAGKTTLMETVSGYAKPSSGKVFLNGSDLYKMYSAFKSIIGYVPQKDIVYGSLTLISMLEYAAQLRLPDDVTPAERKARIRTVLDAVGLNGHEATLISRLSGGQRKRASIAIELLSDPELMFLDEPASGLDPGTERNLMNTLRKMADSGKTIILVTHSTLNLQMCDKIVFMGKGGNLCFCGNEEEAKRFFHKDSLVDTYHLIEAEPEIWRDRYRKENPAEPLREENPASGPRREKNRHGRLHQTLVLCRRYAHIQINDRKRLLMVFLQAPLLAALIALVADGNQFEDYKATKSLLFALSCAAFWIGILNTIQEVCKERHILKREYMTGLHLSAYIASKVAISGILCVIQSLLLTGIFLLLVGCPEKGVILDPRAEFFITTFVTSFCAMTMGIFVSSLFDNADRVMTVAPLLLLPQILFSGLLFELSSVTKYISYFVTCRWSMEGYGTTADLNSLKQYVEINGKLTEIAHEAESYFEYTGQHLLTAWGITAGFAVCSALLGILVLRNIGKNR